MKKVITIALILVIILSMTAFALIMAWTLTSLTAHAETMQLPQ